MNNNLLTNFESLENLTDSETVTSLNLSDNQIEADENLYKIFSKMPLVTVLYLRGTPFVRGIGNYRKNTIFHVKSLLYLDDRSVNPEDKKVANAWKEGGLEAEKEARK